MARVLVCGGRDFADREFVVRTLNALRSERGVSAIIEGGAAGADSFAAEWAIHVGVEHLRFTADWRGHGRAAGPRRNREMLTRGRPDLVLAFPGGRGTANMVAQARSGGVDIIEVAPSQEEG